MDNINLLLEVKNARFIAFSRLFREHFAEFKQRCFTVRTIRNTNYKLKDIWAKISKRCDFFHCMLRYVSTLKGSKSFF